MNSSIERLLSLRVSDVMNRKVVQVRNQHTLAQAAQTFRENTISGAPVVDEYDRCVGVLSATDFVKHHACRHADRGQSHTGAVKDCRQSGATVVDTKGDELVSHYMSTAVKAISTDSSLLAAARMMCTEHIHRLPVLDSQKRVVGMLSSMDIVAAMVHAIDE